MCVYSTVCILSTFTPSSVKKNHRHITRVGWEPTTYTILEQCQTNFFLTIKNKKNTQLSSFSHLYKMYKSFNHKFDTFFRLFYIHVTQISIDTRSCSKKPHSTNTTAPTYVFWFVSSNTSMCSLAVWKTRVSFWQNNQNLFLCCLINIVNSGPFRNHGFGFGFVLRPLFLGVYANHAQLSKQQPEPGPSEPEPKPEPWFWEGP